MSRHLTLLALTALLAAAVAGCGSASVTTTPDGGVAVATVTVAATPPPTSDPADDPSASVEQVAEPAPTPDDVAKVGSTITLAGNDDALQMAATLLAVKDPAHAASEWMAPDAGNRYVAVRVSLRNTGSIAYDDSPSNGAVVVDSQDQSYDASMADVIEPGLGSPKIAVGKRRVGWITFEVPKRAKLVTFQLTLDSGFAEQTGEWALR
jgi:hypothetical protein